MEVKEPDANILSLQYWWPDNTSNMSRASSATSELRKAAQRLYTSSLKYEIPLLHEATQINDSVIHVPMHKRTMIKVESQREIKDKDLQKKTTIIWLKFSNVVQFYVGKKQSSVGIS